LYKNNRYVLIGSLTIIVCVMLAIPFAKATSGTGQLYVYTGTWVEAPKGGPNGDTYFVYPDATYHIRVWNITEFSTGALLTVKIGWTDTSNMSQTAFFYNVSVKEDSDGVRYVEVTWTIPSNAKICTTSTVHYTQKPGPDYVAAGQISSTGHMHIIPELLIGTIGAILALFGAFGIFTLPKTRKTSNCAKIGH